MASVNIKKSNIVTRYYNANSGLIAVAVFDKNSAQKPYKLYKTDCDLKSFELISSSNNPLDFDSILYSKTELNIKKPRSKAKIKPNSSKDTGTVNKSIKRDKLF